MTLAERSEGGGGAEGRGARRGEGGPAFPAPVAEVKVFCRAPAFILMLASFALRSGVRAVETSGGLPNLIGALPSCSLPTLSTSGGSILAATGITELNSLHQRTPKTRRF